jgi:hypothetical protein
MIETVPGHTVKDRVKEILPTVRIIRGLFLQASVQRTGNYDKDNGNAEIQIQGAFGSTAQGEVPYKFSATVVRPDVTIMVEFEIAYSAPDLTAWSDPEFVSVFSNNVALMTVYPYLRTKIHELALTVEVPAPLLDVLIIPPDQPAATSD